MHLLTFIAVAAFVSTATQARPPVQYQRITPDSQLAPAVVGTSNYQLNDRGEILAQLEDDSGRRGFARRSNGNWDWVEPPASFSDPTYSGEWVLNDAQITNQGRVVASAWRSIEGGPFSFAVLEYRFDVPHLSPRVIELRSNAPLVFAANNLGEVVWHGPNALFCSEDPLHIERADGQVEILSDWCDTVLSIMLDRRIDLLFDTGNYLYQQEEEYLDGDTVLTMNRLNQILLLNPKFAADSWVGTSTRGDIGYYSRTQLVWPFTTNLPSVSPPLSLRTDASPFASFNTLKISNAGEVLIGAALDTGGYGFFLGPDLQRDTVLLSTEPILGRAYDGVWVTDFNTRREMVFVANHGPSFFDPDWDAYLATLCPADMNRDQIFDNGDINAFVQTYLAGSLRADFTNDGLLDNADIGEFITQFLNGC